MSPFPLTMSNIKDSFARHSLVFREESETILVVERPSEPIAPLQVHFDLASETATFVVAAPFAFSSERMVEMSCATSLLNSHILLGAWCIDHQNRNLFFRFAVPTSEALFTDNSLIWIVEMTLGHVRLHIESFAAIASGEHSFDYILMPNE